MKRKVVAKFDSYARSVVHVCSPVPATQLYWNGLMVSRGGSSRQGNTSSQAPGECSRYPAPGSPAGVTIIAFIRRLPSF